MLGSSKASARRVGLLVLLLQAQASKAKVVGLANAGPDTANAMKRAAEFGMRNQGQSLVAFLMFVNDVHAMGLKTARRACLLTEAFYWDMNDETRAFAKKFAARMEWQDAQRANQAGVYSSVLAYLKAVAATGSDNAKDVVPQMKKARSAIPCSAITNVRADGRCRARHAPLQVKTPEETSTLRLLQARQVDPRRPGVPPDGEGGCALVK